MTVIRFHLELEKGTDLDAVAQRLERQLSQLERVEKVESAPDEQRSTGVEIIAIVAAAVVVARESGDFVAYLRRFVQELQGLIEDVRGLRRVVFDVGDAEVPLDEMGPDQIAALAESG